MTVFDKILKLRETQGTNAKLVLLKEYSTDETFKKVLFYTYNPFYLYYVSKLPQFKSNDTWQFNLNNCFALLDDLKARVVTGNAALDKISLSMSKMGESTLETFKLMIGRDLKIGLNVTSINKVLPNFIPTFDVMLADSGKTAEQMLNENDWVFVQKKSDGKRCIAIVRKDGVSFYARSGKEIENLNNHNLLINALNHIRSTKLFYDFVLDGELVIENADGTDADRQYSNGLITKKNLPSFQVESFSYIVWDLLSLEDFQNNSNKTPYEDRYYNLVEAIKNYYTNLKIIPTYTVTNAEDAIDITNRFMAEGFEGSIIKTPYHFYERKRSKNWMKYKAILDCDLKVIGYNYGNPGTKYEGLLGSLVCQSSDGLLNVAVGTGFSDELRKSIKEDIIGSIITVQYNQIIKDVNGNYSLFLPAFIEFRDDKSEADTLDKVLSRG